MSAINSFIEKSEYYETKIEDIKIYDGDTNRVNKKIGKIFARADSSLLSKTATMNDVNYRLKEEALKNGGNAVIHVKYKRSSLTSWRGIKANGIAIFAEPDDKKCPYCAEKIKIDAITCKHCGKELKENITDPKDYKNNWLALHWKN